MEDVRSEGAAIGSDRTSLGIFKGPPPPADGPQKISTSQSDLYEGLAEVACTLYKHSLTVLPPDVRTALGSATGRETDRQGRMRLQIMVDAVNTSDRTGIIVCQDTGIPVFFLGLGTEFPVNGARLQEAMSSGIALATERFSLRSSVVHPLNRTNPQTSTGRGVPIFHIEFLDGADWLDLLLVPKGSGSENMSFLAMLTPADGIAGVKRFVLDSVVRAGAKPCPPTIVGVGLGGTADECMALAKRAIARPVGQPHPEQDIAELERQLRDALNATGIGPQGLGGLTTAFAVHIEYGYTHISMNPVAVNIQCWRGERARAKVYVDGKVEYGF
ncbi:fumarate hydratase [Ferrimicrobium acidiphilum]|uniref:fumarate hydratase n=1 Tax=Ferrimicrobium acidiphilum TaxID=121039 RepID=UPI0023F2FD6B|nr:fumarate hydratase [Ferrimicrobium acidiphilum]